MTSFITVYAKHTYADQFTDDIPGFPAADSNFDMSYPVVTIPFGHEGDRDAAIEDAKKVIEGKRVQNRVTSNRAYGETITYALAEIKILETID